MVESCMASKKRKKRKSRTAKRVATAVLAASVGAEACLGHEKEHVELVQASPDTSIALLTDAAIIATSTAVSTVTVTRSQWDRLK